MPNFNGAIIVHTLQLLKIPATVRQIVNTISRHTDLPEEDIKKPVKQTLEMGTRLGFLQKMDGRYYLVPMTFENLMSEMQELDLPGKSESQRPVRKAKKEKKVTKTKSEGKTTKKQIKKPAVESQTSTTTMVPSVLKMSSKPKAVK
ncbi:uncharacterized protein LOC108161982 [Drosophila miranda]|uniref:uncharacterized protein LOC108161982 n=1 Tax=Drosophila miranda TaxID=7229 RepID=UPI0007E71DAE|nr:uncharacterized protein LOC108161982 [Drosophila miranda]XP_033249118.1 uncharacterized protein LOC108161982 [Drosophila miranda]